MATLLEGEALRQLQITAEHAKQNLFFFGNRILGNHFLDPNVHGKLAEWLDGPYTCPDCTKVLPWQIVDPPKVPKLESGHLAPIVCPSCQFEIPRRKRFRLVLIPRDCLKTTFLNIIRPLHKLLRDPNRRMLIGSENHGLAIDILGAIKNTIDHHSHFRLYQENYFGMMNGQLKGYKWAQDAITVGTRTNFDAKEHNIETCGVDVTKVGRHFKDINIDDPHSEKNIQNKDQIEKVVKWIKLLMPMLEDDGNMTIVGTRWDDKDAYQWSIDVEEGDELDMDRVKSQMFDCFIRGAVTASGKAYYPLRNSLPSLVQKKTSMGDYLYSCQYMNDPVPEGGATFDTSQIQYMSRKNVPKNLFKVMLVDPASMEEKDRMASNRDDTAIVCIGIDPHVDVLGLRRVILLDLAFGDWAIDQAVEALTSMFFRQRPNLLGVERQGMSMFATTLVNRVGARGGYISVHDLKPANRGKDTRIMSLQPYINNGKFWVVSEIPEVETFVHMLRRFPRGKKRDPLDAAAYLEDIIRDFQSQIRSMADRNGGAPGGIDTSKRRPVCPETGY